MVDFANWEGGNHAEFFGNSRLTRQHSLAAALLEAKKIKFSGNSCSSTSERWTMKIQVLQTIATH